MTLEELRDKILNTTAREKTLLPWLKLAVFGREKSPKGSLRHDKNVLSIRGTEADYDGERVSFEEAVEALQRNHITALLYTSPSHTNEAPRWRVLCPTSRDLPPSERKKLVARVNGVLGGVLGRESFTVSQSFFLGSVDNNPDHKCEIVYGDHIDLRDDLDEGAIWPKDHGEANDNPFLSRADAQSFKPPLDVDAALADMTHGNIHDTQVRVTASLMANGFSVDDAVALVLDATKRLPDTDGWNWGLEEREIERMCLDAIDKGFRDRATMPTADMKNAISAKKMNGASHPMMKVGATEAAVEGDAARLELEQACAGMTSARDSKHSDTLNRLSFQIGQLVGAGRLVEATARARLIEAAQEVMPDGMGIEATIDKGMNSGKAVPRLPTIVVAGGSIADNIDLSESELIASGVPIFQRGLSLVKPVRQVMPAANNSKTEVILLRELQPENMVFHLNRDAVVFKKYDARKKKNVVIDPPKDIARGLLKKGAWQFPQVSGVITSPTMRPDGSVLDQPGYDEATRLYYSPDRYVSVPPIAPAPSRADALAALAKLRDLIAGFPFVSALDEAVALAGLMTPVLRGAFPVAPMFLKLAPTAGTGKSLLVSLAAVIASGRAAPVITSVKSMDEMEKRLGALVLEGAQIISLDNCSDDIGGDLLCQVTEQPVLRIRILGTSEAPQCEWRGTLPGCLNWASV